MLGDTLKVHYGRCASGVCLAGFLKCYRQMDLRVKILFSGQKLYISKVAIIKTKSAKLLFLFSSFLPRSFFFSFFFWSLSGSKMTGLGWFSKNRLGVHVHIYAYLIAQHPIGGSSAIHTRSKKKKESKLENYLHFDRSP